MASVAHKDRLKANPYLSTPAGRRASRGGGGGSSDPAHIRDPASEQELADLWVTAGGPEQLAGLMAAIAKRFESGGKRKSSSSARCCGYWQICPPIPNCEDPLTNARAAVGKWQGQGLKAWADFGSPAERRFILGAIGGDTNMLGPGKLPNVSAAGLKTASFGNPGNFGTSPDLPSPGDIVGSLTGPITAIADAIVQLANAWKDVFDFLTTSEVWITTGKIVLGALLILTGAREVYRAAAQQGVA